MRDCDYIHVHLMETCHDFKTSVNTLLSIMFSSLHSLCSVCVIIDILKQLNVDCMSSKRTYLKQRLYVTHAHTHTHTHTSTVNRATSLAVTQLLWGSYTGFTSIIISIDLGDLKQS